MEKFITEVIDDVTGNPAESVEFEFKGQKFTVDVDPLRKNNLTQITEAHARKVEAENARFAEKMGPFLEHATPVGATKPKAKRGKSDAAVIRAWALENGIEVGERGRVSTEVRALYAARDRG